MPTKKSSKKSARALCPMCIAEYRVAYPGDENLPLSYLKFNEKTSTYGCGTGHTMTSEELAELNQNLENRHDVETGKSPIATVMAEFEEREEDEPAEPMTEDAFAEKLASLPWQILPEEPSSIEEKPGNPGNEISLSGETQSPDRKEAPKTPLSQSCHDVGEKLERRGNGDAKMEIWLPELYADVVENLALDDRKPAEQWMQEFVESRLEEFFGGQVHA